jgi:hypothetical protein
MAGRKRCHLHSSPKSGVAYGSHAVSPFLPCSSYGSATSNVVVHGRG